jgi:hypothetical protein
MALLQNKKAGRGSRARPFLLYRGTEGEERENEDGKTS